MTALAQRAVLILQKYVGSYYAKAYADFYQDKDDTLIRTSVRQLLTELLGDRKANEIINKELGGHS